MNGERVTAYSQLGSITRVCSLGHEHELQVYGQRFLYPTEKSVTRDFWGYGQVETAPVYRDRLGNEYVRVGPLDFSGSTTFRPYDNTGYASGKMLSIRKPPRGIRFDEV